VSEARELFHDLIRFETELWSAIDERLLADVGLPLSWFEPMTVIDQNEVCRVNDIAEALSITVGGTSKLVDRLETAGLCVRRPNPDDRRSSLISLTPSGEQRLADAAVVFDDELARWFALSDSTIDRFHAVLRRLRANARTLRHHDTQESDHG
jgi:DNA-binding MarR family transcriptional regulator